VIRAPYIIRAMDLEWLYRLAGQPWRFKRQLALVHFVLLVVKEYFREVKNSMCLLDLILIRRCQNDIFLPKT